MVLHSLQQHLVLPLALRHHQAACTADAGVRHVAIASDLRR
jgi:hypothetical protein